MCFGFGVKLKCVFRMQSWEPPHTTNHSVRLLFHTSVISRPFLLLCLSLTLPSFLPHSLIFSHTLFFSLTLSYFLSYSFLCSHTLFFSLTLSSFLPPYIYYFLSYIQTRTPLYCTLVSYWSKTKVSKIWLAKKGLFSIIGRLPNFC